MPLAGIKDRLGNLTDREKILAIALASVLCVTVAAAAFALVQGKAGDLESAVAANERILESMLEKKEDLKDQFTKKRTEQARFEKAPPQLLGLLEKLAGEVGLEIPESRDLPDETKDKRWIHKSAEIRLRKIGLDTLVKLMVKIKNRNRELPLAVTKMNIKKRQGEPNSYDVQMTVSTYTIMEKKVEKKRKKGKLTKDREEKEVAPAEEEAARPSGREMEVFGPEL